MGVTFDRFLENFDGPFEQIRYGELQNPKGSMDANATAGYILNAKTNNSFVAVNDLLKDGVEVYRLADGVADKNGNGAGSFMCRLAQRQKAFCKKKLRRL